MKPTEYKVLGSLPDPFLFKDGHRLKSADEWPERRKELFRDTVEWQYGELLPEPEFLEAERLYPFHDAANEVVSVRITSGRRDHPVSFMMYVHMPDDYRQGRKCPAVIDGDLCFSWMHEDASWKPFTTHGIMFVKFNRTELASDMIWQCSWEEGRRGPLFEAYPECRCGVLMAWAWGYSRCVDALIKLGYLDESMLAFTGCSRGAKTALLAGALDTRATIVNPIETNAGGAACYRIHMKALNDAGEEKPSETLADIWKNFPSWFGPDYGRYAEHEEDLPFDCHEMKAMIAPRTLIVGEAENDIWGNPLGCYQTSVAAKEVWKLFGHPEDMLYYWREGDHGHTPFDMELLVNLMRHKRDGVPLDKRFYHVPFEKPELIFNWACPEKE